MNWIHRSKQQYAIGLAISHLQDNRKWHLSAMLIWWEIYWYGVYSQDLLAWAVGVRKCREQWRLCVHCGRRFRTWPLGRKPASVQHNGMPEVKP